MSKEEKTVPFFTMNFPKSVQQSATKILLGVAKYELDKRK